MSPAPSISHTERKKKYVGILKANGTFGDYKKKRAQLEKSRRARKKEAIAKLSESKRKLLIEEERLKTRKRVRKHRNGGCGDESQHRENRTAQAPSKTTFDFEHSYKTKSAIGKAYTKANKGLPSSPTKRKVMATKIFRSFGAKDQDDISGKSNPKVNESASTGLKADLIEAVEHFYERDDVSRISPNVNDVKSIRNPATGEKELQQIRHLTLTLADAFNKFVDEYRRENDCDPAVKLTKFCELRPKHVLLLSETPRNVCFCIYHSNFGQCCTAINKYAPEIPKEYNKVVELLVCENGTKDCYFKKCKQCSSAAINTKLKSMCRYSASDNRSVSWMKWVKDKAANRLQNELQTGTKQELVDYLITIYAQFLKHSFVMHEQHDSFVEDQIQVDSVDHFGEATLNIDFPENFKCESQDEIQQANYNQKQISLFIAVLQHRKQLHSTAIASDNTHHTKDTIVAYLYKVLSARPATVKIVKIWSDGPSSQFKNKYMTAVISLLEKKFGLKIFWNFFATAHGKACVDGIGATVKKKVRSMILSKKKIVYNTDAFVEAFNSKDSKVNLFGLNDQEIDQINAELKLSEVFSQAPNVPGISECHQLQVINGRAKCYTTSKEGYGSL